jgi:transcriptional regulator with XRE-family HTH domain
MSRELGARIRRLRQERGLTQAELAGSRLSESYVSLIESGRRNPTSEVVDYLAEVLSCSPEVLSGEEEAPDAASVELLIRRGEWETNSGALGAAQRHLAEGVAVAQRLGLQALAVRGQMAIAKALEMEGRLREAANIWEELLVESNDDARNVPAVAVTVALSRCCRELGDLDRAIAVGESYWATVGDLDRSNTAATEDAVVVGATLLAAYLEMGDQQRCRDLGADLLKLADTADTPMAAAAAYWNVAIAAEAEGRTGEALRLAERAHASLALTQDVRNRARLQTTLAGLHLRIEPPETAEAVRLLVAAEPVLEQFGTAVDLGYCRTEMARAHLQNHEFERARCLADTTAKDLGKAAESPIELARTLMVLAASQSMLDRKEEARANARSAADLLERAGATRQAASSWTELAELCVELGDSTSAIDAFRHATELLGARKTPGAATAAEAAGAPPASQAATG